MPLVGAGLSGEMGLGGVLLPGEGWQNSGQGSLGAQSCGWHSPGAAGTGRGHIVTVPGLGGSHSSPGKSGPGFACPVPALAEGRKTQLGMRLRGLERAFGRAGNAAGIPWTG